MVDSENNFFPLLGIGWLSGVEEDHLVFCLLLLEMIIFVLLDGVSWYLLCAGLAIYFWPLVKHEVGEMLKKITIFFVPRVDEDPIEDITASETPLVAVEDKAAVSIPRFPKTDEESVGWINDIIEKVWSVCLSPIVSKEDLNTLLKAFAEGFEDGEPQVASLLKQVSVEKISIGSCPLQITKMKSRSDQRDELKIDVTLLYPGNAEVVLKWENPELYAIGRNLGFCLSFQVALGPVHRDLSILGGLSVSMLEQPILMVDGGGILYCPVELVKRVINIIIKPILEWLVQKPRCISVSFSDDQMHWPQLGEPAGMLRVFLVEGRDLIAADRSILSACGVKKGGGTSDPFCMLQVDRRWLYSNMVNKSLNPVWNFYAEFPILSPGPAGQELLIEVFDKDFGAENDTLGGTSVDLGSLDLRGRVSDAWLDVESVDVASGQIRVRVQWVPCLNSPQSSLKNVSYDEPCSKAILIVHVKSIETNCKVEPMISLQISGENFQTTAKGELCQQHDFEEEMMLLVKDPDSDWLRISLFDLSSDTFNTKKLLKKGLSVVHSNDEQVLNCDRVAHKGMVDSISFPLVGDLMFPVRMFREEEDIVHRLSAKMEIDARIHFSAKLFLLKAPRENVT